MTDKVLIAGLGLIGGSLAKAIRNVHPDVHLMGYDVDEDILNRAKVLGVIDETTTSLATAKTADVIILAAPVNNILSLMTELSGYDLKDDVIITDVGSTKQNITAAAKRDFAGQYTFIGGHPMAGSHKTGVDAAQAHLFENAYYFLTPIHVEDKASLDQLIELLKGTRAKFTPITPDEHDRVVGVISHFPHVAASGLVHHLMNVAETGSQNVRKLAAGGFRDITRIASSDPKMWADIVLDNQSVLLDLFEEWQQVMDRAKSMIQTGNWEQIYTYFSDAKVYRDQFPVKDKRVAPAFYDLYVDVNDEPGVIAKLTEMIGAAGVNIQNIGVIEWRENILGVLRLTFSREPDRRAATAILEGNQYKTYIND
ncbi:prephenate dehydrogenase [Tuberibacillus sp. Marseille-P3662]|uniref:prephenate dehydrogenase n=1 Tax=Tuberibacillus sp. Marseille-P3662 TaxID=1965358 RepID=UPI000A1CDDD7|nr:prephenate dehydrogenase [Tuberibacillus sp. Marseille-P3662]